VGLGQGRPKIQKERNLKILAFRRSEFSELQNRKFSFPFQKKFGRATSKKCRENFSVLELKFLQNFRAESGAKRKLSSKVFLEKSSSFGV